MKTWKLWGLLLGVWLSGCAASGTVLHEAQALDTTYQEAQEEEGESCLVLLCDEEVCGFFRCEAVAQAVATVGSGEEVVPGQVVKTWANPGVAVNSGSPMRYWGGPLPLPKQKGAVFVIPWRNHHLRNLLPSQQQQMEEADEKLNRPHEKHHLFPQAFKKWFKSKGIDIHRWTMFIETTLHKSIHRGPNGGPWNAAWWQFIRENEGREVTKEEIWKHAWELCVRFGVMAPLQPYYGKTRLPPPIEF
ncbi:SitA6 family polymorphic toxin lipoprotein [Archangium lipolyticum]|uniref:SitA6 family polymorphic toxin lipoprotein n=1 Tax=Archangium lipolyticum TaxID=2970465 RepID=UPI00214A5F7B|nr:TIGR02269 family lipoprotein [Archangium lipolyticum]